MSNEYAWWEGEKAMRRLQKWQRMKDLRPVGRKLKKASKLNKAIQMPEKQPAEWTLLPFLALKNAYKVSEVNIKIQGTALLRLTCFRVSRWNRMVFYTCKYTPVMGVRISAPPLSSYRYPSKKRVRPDQLKEFCQTEASFLFSSFKVSIVQRK